MNLKKIATLHNDGTPHGRLEWEPGEGPEKPLWTHTEHMAWGRQMFVSGFSFGIFFTVLTLSLVLLLK